MSTGRSLRSTRCDGPPSAQPAQAPRPDPAPSTSVTPHSEGSRLAEACPLDLWAPALGGPPMAEGPVASTTCKPVARLPGALQGAQVPPSHPHPLLLEIRRLWLRAALSGGVRTRKEVSSLLARLPATGPTEPARPGPYGAHLSKPADRAIYHIICSENR